MLQAQFLSVLPDVHLLFDTVEYINLSFNKFQVKTILISYDLLV